MPAHIGPPGPGKGNNMDFSALAQTAGVAGSLVGGYLQNEANAKNVAAANAANMEIMKRTNKFNREERRANQSWQRMMASTAYQRATMDMKRAGLNPMLAYQQGGAATPSGGQASGSSIPSQAAHAEEILGPAVNSALETRRLRKEIEAVASANLLNDANRGAANAQAELNKANAKLSASQDANARASEAMTRKEMQVIDANLPVIRSRNRLEMKRNEYDEKAVGYDALMKRVQQGAGVLNDVVDMFKPKLRLPPSGGGSMRGTDRIIDKNTGEILHEKLR